MGLDTVTVGANQREVGVIGDPTSASAMLSVGQFHTADGQSLGGSLWDLLIGSVKLLYNGTTFDRQRAAVGTLGIPAVNSEGTKPTYSGGTTAFVPVASATDFFGLVGSGSKTVRVTRISISGFATAAISEAISLVKRTTANSGSTPADLTPVLHDNNDSAPTAVIRTYTTTNPTLGTGVAGRSKKLNLGATGAAGSVEWDFTTRNGKGMVLRGVAQGLFLNWNGAAVPAGTSLDFDVEWTEE